MTICDPYGDPGPGDPLCNEVLLSEALRSRDAKRYPDPAPRTDVWNLRFYARGTNDECLLRQRLEDPDVGIPGVFQGQPLEYYETRNIGWQLWEVTATYNWYGPHQVDDLNNTFNSLPSQITLSTAGGRTKLTQSIFTASKYPIAGAKSPPDFKGAVNWDGQRVQGVDVGAASPRYTETWIVNRAFLFSPITVYEADDTYEQGPPPVGGKQVNYTSRIELFTDYTWTVHGQVPGLNSANHPVTQLQNFRQWRGGNVALAGVNVRQIAMDHFEVTLEFQIQPTKNFIIPESIEPSTPEEPDGVTFIGEGWNYLWFYYAQQEATANTGEADEYKMNAAVPIYMYEEQIYRRKDFSNLGFGIAPFDYAFQNLMCMASPDLDDAWHTFCSEAPP